MMARLTIDNIEVEVAEGATLLDAAQVAGARVPTLCYEKSIGAITSCMVCLVKDAVSGRMMPACATRAVDGMCVDTRSDEVRAARREVLQMLISEHAGDCEAPCRRVCPASLNIPLMLRHVAEGRVGDATQLAHDNLIFPATLGRVCTAPCQMACRRGAYDEPVSIRAAHGQLAEEQAVGDGVKAASTGRRIAVIGAGVAGLSAAAVCARLGHDCRVFEKESIACQSLRIRFKEQLPDAVLDAEIRVITQMGVELAVNSERTLDSFCNEYDAVIVACGLAGEGPHVFRAKEAQMPVRSVALGKAAALQADAFLRGTPDHETAKRFNCQIGKLNEHELPAYAIERRVDAPAVEAPAVAAARCLGCDCRKGVTCKLRAYAEEYGVDARAERHMERPEVERIQRFGDVLFEPGKCIKCGLCEELCRAAGAPYGLTLAGRGLASHVDVPLGGRFEDAPLAARCAAACPTGALAVRHEETP